MFELSEIFIVSIHLFYFGKKGLYLCGGDLATPGLAGEFQGGWLSANAVLGYTSDELKSLSKNLASDLKNVPQ